jgi:putative heme-binding domain-containing protein
LDGRGGERAPNIASNAKTQRLSDAQLSTIITKGISGTGMPAFHSLSPVQLRSVVSYLRTLQGKSKSRALPGDASNGKKIFFGKGECSTCHVITGEGGFLGPDLSGYGAAIPVQTILDDILNSKRIVPAGYKLATATTVDGASIEGIVRNEDNFSVQLQAKDGSFHFFQKSELQKLEYRNESLMPTDYGKRLSREELNDLVSYLMTAGSAPGKANAGTKAETKKDSE